MFAQNVALLNIYNRTIVLISLVLLTMLAATTHVYAQEARLSAPAVYSLDTKQAKFIRAQATSCNSAQLACLSACSSVYNGQYNLCTSKPSRDQPNCKSQAWSALQLCSSQCYSQNPCP